MPAAAPSRLGLVVHPSRPVEDALDTLRAWAQAHGVDVVQLVAGRPGRVVAPPGEVHGCDVVVAIGGDGTVLTALRASAPTRAPVLGVACGSLGALSAVQAEDLGDALDRFAAGDWSPRELPALAVECDGTAEETAINDFVVVRRGTGQLAATVTVGDELYVRLAGDGLIVATALGSSAYSMAAGGPIIAGGTQAYICTPLAMHGGSAPPLVVPADAIVSVEAHPGFAGFDVEIDGHPREGSVQRFTIRLEPERVRLVGLGPAGYGLTALRRRRLITDSPRILARDDRAAGRP